ncbi:hypothetical protein SCUCBS95973_001163 [Sporothrix curviconia]|uniref:Heterokaryon incompatibility domain-containing protein n=1 Tax=Sporothrix curviconia TaxID=1260050 RepID=A0ABP0AWH8_9PEZI
MGSAKLVGEPYKYSSIKNEKEIRLLELFPGSGNDEVRVALYSAPIESLPPFEAISYCWGDASQVETILCNDTPLVITTSLHGALKRFRPAPGPDAKPRTIWADAICIQQTDLVEKACQVMHMPQVYSQAWRVLVWLGEEEEDGSLDGVAESLAVAKEFLPDTPLDVEGLHQTAQGVLNKARALQKEGRPNFLDHDWVSLLRLLERPWFRRKWVIQEVCLAKDAIVYCGNITFPWSTLAYVAYNTMASGVLLMIVGNTSLVAGMPFMEDHSHDHDDKGEKADSDHIPQYRKVPAGATLIFQNIQVMHMIRTFRHAGTLLDCVIATASFDCTNPRDYVYALLSLPVHPTSHQVIPNYLQTPAETFIEFAVATLIGEQNLKLLSTAPAMSRPRPARFRTGPDGKPIIPPYTFSEPMALPSWVPNLTGSGLINPFASYSVLPQMFHTGGAVTPPVAVSDDKKLLYLQARIVDTIDALIGRNVKYNIPTDADAAPFLPRFKGNLQMARNQLWMRNYLRICQKFVQGAPAGELDSSTPSKTPMTPAQWLTFARVMTCEQNNRRDALPPAVYDAFDEYVEHIYNVFADETEAEGERDEAAAANIERMMAQYGVMLESSVLSMSSMRLLGRTAAGRLGQLPLEVRLGDKVAVVIGGETPFIVRPIDKPEGEAGASWQPDEERYQLIGEAYISGIMQGETLADERYTTKEITIQ